MIKTLKDINWNQVYYFYEVARKMSMKEAANLIGVSTPTVSEQIKKLENVLDIKLFKRLPRKIELTKEGESLFNSAKEIFDAGGRFLDSISPNFIGGYTAKVGIQESICASIAVDFVTLYWDLFAPYGTVNTVREAFFERSLEKLLHGEFDWAILTQQPKSSKVNFKEIARCEVVFCCSTQIFKKFKHKADILRSIPLARSRWDFGLNQAVDDHLRTLDVFPEEVIDSDHFDFCLQLAKRGRCVMPMAKETFKQINSDQSLKMLALDISPFITFYAAWLKANEKMVCLKKLTHLLDFPHKPKSWHDPEWQIKLNPISP